MAFRPVPEFDPLGIMPARHVNYDAIEAALNWQFTDRALLAEALTHASAKGATSNERLEFLGDRVLGLVIAEHLIQRYPNETEGHLAPRLNGLVSRETCAEIAVVMELGGFIQMSRSEALNGGRRKNALLANAMEAIIAAIYIDGGLEAAKVFILQHWAHHLDEQRRAPADPKTTLQEWAQARGHALPHYTIVDRTGPDHAPVFTIRVTLSTGETADAQASSKRLGERACAEALLNLLDNAS